jgi:anion-transporting  ArsA/GET3 family ATPase
VSDTLEELLRRRLLIVTGKGGSGKTTVAATLAMLAAQRGIDTVLVDLADGADTRRLVAKDPDALPAGDGRTPVAVSAHLFALTIDPEVALTEYLEIELVIRPLARLIVRNPGVHLLLEAAPGWRDLITLGKLWHLITRQRDGVRPWQLLVVDAPATGHGISFLSVPRVVIDAVRLGPIRRHTDAVQAMLTNPGETRVVPVTLAEELPVRETLELCQNVRALGVGAGPVIVNGVEFAPELPPLGGLLADLSAERPPAELAPLLAPDIVRAVLAHTASRGALHRSFIEKLRAEVGSRVARLPSLAEGVEGPAALGRLAEALEGELR